MSREITWEELRKHNNDNDGHWMLIDGFVYDVTDFKGHPGGYKAFQANSGRNSSLKFNTIHKPSTHKFKENYLIGKIVDDGCCGKIGAFKEVFGVFIFTSLLACAFKKLA